MNLSHIGLRKNNEIDPGSDVDESGRFSYETVE